MASDTWIGFEIDRSGLLLLVDGDRRDLGRIERALDHQLGVGRVVHHVDVLVAQLLDDAVDARSDAWIIDALKAVGCDTAKSVLELSVEEIASRADLEMEQAQKVVEILKAEFE